MIKLKSLIKEDFDNWKGGVWIHYTDVDYLKIREEDSQSEISGDPSGIYMFPEKATKDLRFHFFKQKKYKMVIQITDNITILDLSRITKKTIEDFGMDVEQLKQVVHYPGGLIANKTSVSIPKAFWTILRRQQNNGVEFRKLLMSKGYDAVFDDVGAIHSKNEVQLCVFDPSNLQILKIVPNDL